MVLFTDCRMAAVDGPEKYSDVAECQVDRVGDRSCERTRASASDPGYNERGRAW